MTALRNYTSQGEYDKFVLYFEDDAKLLISHLRRAGSGSLSEAEVLARELVASRKFMSDLKPQIKLLKVLAAQAAQGLDGKATALQECREELCSLLVAQLNSELHPASRHDLFDRATMYRVGYHRDGSGSSPDDSVRELLA